MIDLDDPTLSPLQRAVFAEFNAMEAATAKRTATKARNDAVLASAPGSAEASTILAQRAYMKTAKANAKARGYKPLRRL